MRFLTTATMCLLMLASIFRGENKVTTYAAEVPEQIQLTDDTEIQIIGYDKENDRSLAVISVSHSANADVCGDGVRLRATPSLSGTILELMYNGEYVWIDWSQYGNGGSNWYRVQRMKTGTYGWVQRDYIASWD